MLVGPAELHLPDAFPARCGLVVLVPRLQATSEAGFRLVDVAQQKLAYRILMAAAIRQSMASELSSSPLNTSLACRSKAA